MNAALQKRILSALVGIPLVLAAVFLTGRGVFLGVILVLFLIALWEYLRLCRVGAGLTLAAMTGGALSVAAVSAGMEFAFFGVGLLLVLVASLWRVDDPERRFRALAEAVLGMAYLGFSLICFYRLREIPGGAFWLVLLLAVVWGGDSLAFYGGSRFGKKLLAAQVSPRKTRGGAAWGVAGSVAGGVVLAGLFRTGLPLSRVVYLSIMVGVAGQLGDLLQSLWKRAKGAKDSGNLIPGHGGLLDRIDSILLGVPVGYLMIRNWGF